MYYEQLSFFYKKGPDFYFRFGLVCSRAMADKVVLLWTAVQLLSFLLNCVSIRSTNCYTCFIVELFIDTVLMASFIHLKGFKVHHYLLILFIFEKNFVYRYFFLPLLISEVCCYLQFFSFFNILAWLKVFTGAFYLHFFNSVCLKFHINSVLPRWFK